jgi:hypothetical protein
VLALKRRFHFVIHDGGSLHIKLPIWHVSMRQLGDAVRRKLRMRDKVVAILNNAFIIINRSINRSIEWHRRDRVLAIVSAIYAKVMLNPVQSSIVHYCRRCDSVRAAACAKSSKLRIASQPICPHRHGRSQLRAHLSRRSTGFMFEVAPV